MLYHDFIEMMTILEEPSFDLSRMERLLEEGGDNKFEGIMISSSKLSSIKRFYESTNDFNRSKITDLINNNIDNFSKVYRIVLDYEKNKQRD